jgi:polyisoprenoid-binding protein YceI
MIPGAGRLVLDATAIRVHFVVRWFGVIRVRGVFTRCQAEIDPPCAEHTDCQVFVAVDAHSVSTGIDLRDRHLRSSRFLHADLYPTIRFEGHEVTVASADREVQGELVLRGVSAPLRARVTRIEERGATARLTLEATVLRRPHGVGVPPGLGRFNPMFAVIANGVEIVAHCEVPVAALQPASVAAAAD